MVVVVVPLPMMEMIQLKQKQGVVMLQESAGSPFYRPNHYRSPYLDLTADAYGQASRVVAFIVLSGNLQRKCVLNYQHHFYNQLET